MKSIEEIKEYLSEVKSAVKSDRYTIALNSKRQANNFLFDNYVIDEAMAKEILLSLKATDFSHTLQNEHKGYENEVLYVFEKTVKLLERYGTSIKDVSLYIKFNKLEDCFVIVISFHEQKYPLEFPYKNKEKGEM